MNNKVLQSVAMSAEADMRALGAEEVSYFITYGRYIVDITVTKMIEDADNDTENA